MINYCVVLVAQKVEYVIHGLMSKKGEKDKISSKENIRDNFCFFFFCKKY